MKTIVIRPVLFIATAIFLMSALLPAAAVLFDASHHEMAANADWVIDSDAWNLTMNAYPCTGTTNEANPQRYPTPDQSGVTGSTLETYWKGGISAWGIELVKAGHSVETLPDGSSFTYGTPDSQDLSNYDLVIIVEPNKPFSSGEITALLNFVAAGGGLFMVADHETSDRDCDGWDSPHIFNDLTGATSATDAGVFGIWFRVDGTDTRPSEDWFDDPTGNNVSTDPLDPIIHGPFGDGSGGLGFFGATSMDINLSDNPTVKAHVWRTGQAHDNFRVTFATAAYGSGRVAAIGDSSPADDGTGDSGDTLYDGWDKASGGVNNREIHLNACDWLINAVPDTTDPQITAGPSADPADCSAVITWTTDESATSGVDYGETDAYGSTETLVGLRTSHSITLTGLSPSTLYHYQVYSSDASGNGPTYSNDSTFSTTATTQPTITAGPFETNLADTSVTISWTTDKTGDSTVRYGTSPALGSTESMAESVTDHVMALSGLTSSTLYYYEVETTDACGNTVTSSPFTFTTAETPPQLDISGWKLINTTNSQYVTIMPAGTFIESGGYVVVGRNNSQAGFETEWGALPSGTVYVNSGDKIVINSSSYAYRLEDDIGTIIDGPTVSSDANLSVFRVDNCGDPGLGATWHERTDNLGDPGAGAPTTCGAGVVITEMTDGASSINEYIELFYDGGMAEPDTTPPVISNVSVTPSECSALITWTTDEDANSIVEYGLSDPPLDSQFDGTRVTSHSIPLNGLTPGTLYYYRVGSTDASNNGPAWSSVSTFTTSAATQPAITVGPFETNLADTSVTISWTTDKEGDSTVRYGTTPALGSTESLTESITNHVVPLSGLTASTLYYYEVETRDVCGNTVTSSPFTFSTTDTPTQLDISGWKLINTTNSQYVAIMPAGTFIQSGGYVVVGRNNTRAGFETEWGALPSGTVYINSGDELVINSSNYAYRLEDEVGTIIEGPTVGSGANLSVYRVDNCGESEVGSTWQTRTDTLGDPGAGAPTSCGAGIVITEMTDGASSNNEYIELFYDGGVTEPDTTPPVVSSVSATPAECSALITWTTDEDASSIVEYGLSDPPTGNQFDGTRVTSHSIPLTGLDTGTLYYFRVGSTDASGNGPTWSSVSTFTTSESYPAHSGITESPISNVQTTISFTTDEDTNSTVEYGTTLTYGSTQSDGPATNHSLVLSGLTQDTPYHYRIRSTDACGLETISEDRMFVTAPDGVGPSTDHLVISQIQTQGAANHDDECVELYNPTGAAISLSGKSIQYKSDTGSTYTVVALPSVSIPSHEYFLLARSGGYLGSVTPDLTYSTFYMGAGGGNLFLVNSTSALSGSCSTDASIIDKVAWGTGNCPETTSTPAHDAGQSLVRLPGGTSGSGQDTDVNVNDFFVDTSPTPHNSSSPAASPSSSLGNVRVSLFLTKGVDTTDLDWGTAAGATGYIVYWGTAPDFMGGTPDSWQTVISEGTDDRSPSPIYFYDVRATNGTDISDD